MRWRFFCFFISLCGIAGASQAALDLELTQGIDSATPIAIVPFSGQVAGGAAGAPDTLAAVIGADLQNTGEFRLLSAEDAPPSAATMERVDYDFWRSAKADDVVVGRVGQAAGQTGQAQVVFRLFDVYGRAPLLGEQYTVVTTQLRRLAHHIADRIYQQLTGVRGIFSTQIAYVLVQRVPGRPTKYSLVVSDADGFNPRVLLVSPQPMMSPAWSPDGKALAYVSFEGGHAAVYVQAVASGQRRVLTNYPGINGSPAWSPDGTKIALVLTKTGYPKIYVMDVSGGGLRQLTDGVSLDTEPAWAPDGRSLVFTSSRGGGPQIYRVSAAGGAVSRVTYLGDYNARASFTADGKTLVMLQRDGALFAIAAQDLDSGRVTVLTDSGMNASPSVAPNGKMVVYSSQVDGRGVLGEVSIDGRVKLRLPAKEGEVQEPAWSPFVG